MTNAEIDRLVAEKVMGWILPDETITYWSNWRDANGNELRSVKAWQPTADIAQAWQVLEDENSRLRQLCDLSSAGGDGFRLVRSHPEGVYRLDYMIPAHVERGPDAPSACLAICLAALTALGVEVET